MHKIWMLFSAVLALTSPTAFAASDYPNRTIRIVVAFPPGGVTDLVARVLAEGMRDKLKQTVIVENKAGGEGLVGMREVVTSKPDGYTLLAGGFGGQVLAPVLNQHYPYDVMKVLTPLSQATEFINAVLVNKDLPVSDLSELIAYAKANPGKLNYASEGVGTSGHLATELFMQTAGVKMVHVPYKGAPAALNDLRSGIVQVMFANMPAAIATIRGNAVKILALTSDKRSDLVPEVPTATEKALPGFVVSSWNALYAPANLPEDIRVKLSIAIAETVKDPMVQERFKAMAVSPVGSETRAFEVFWQSELQRWKQVVTKADIKIEH